MVVADVSIVQMRKGVEVLVHVPQFMANYLIESRGDRRQAIIAIMRGDDVSDECPKQSAGTY